MILNGLPWKRTEIILVIFEIAPKYCISNSFVDNEELNVEQQTCSRLGKEYIKAVYCHHAYLTYMQSTSREMLSWRKHKIARRNISNLRYADDTTLMAESEEELKSLLMMKVKEESKNVGLKLNIQKTNIMASVPSLHGK